MGVYWDTFSYQGMFSFYSLVDIQLELNSFSKVETMFHIVKFSFE